MSTTLERSQVVRVEVTMSRMTTGWMPTKRLPQLGRNGRILGVKLREDPTDASATAGKLYLADDGLTATPDDLKVIYGSGSIALTGSATTASLDVTLAAPIPYAVKGVGDVRIGMELTAGGANLTTVYAVVYAEVVG